MQEAVCHRLDLCMARIALEDETPFFDCATYECADYYNPDSLRRSLIHNSASTAVTAAPAITLFSQNPLLLLVCQFHRGRHSKQLASELDVDFDLNYRGEIFVAAERDVATINT